MKLLPFFHVKEKRSAGMRSIESRVFFLRFFSSLTIGAIFFVAILLRLWKLDSLSFWFDEATSVCYSRAFSSGFFFLNHYFGVLNFLLEIFGVDEFWLRIPSVFFSLGALFLLYWLARNFFRPVEATLALFFMALSPFQIWYAQEVRYYSALQFWGLAAVCGIFLLHKTRGQKGWWLFVFSSAGGLNVHLFYLPYFLIHLVIVLGIYRKKIGWRRLIILGCAILVIIPRIIFFLDFIGSDGMISKIGWMSKPTLGAFFYLLKTFFSGFYFYGPFAFLATGLIWVVLGIVFLPGHKKEPAPLGLLCQLFVFPFFSIFLFAFFFFPIFIDRGLIVIAPLAYLLVAIGCFRIQKLRVRRICVVLIALLELLGIFFHFSGYGAKNFSKNLIFSGVQKKQNYRLAAEYLAKTSGPRDIVLFGCPAGFYSIFLYSGIKKERFFHFYDHAQRDDRTRERIRPVFLERQRRFPWFFQDGIILSERFISATQLLNVNSERVFFVMADWEGGIDRGTGHPGNRAAKQFLDMNFRYTKEVMFEDFFVLEYNSKEDITPQERRL